MNSPMDYERSTHATTLAELAEPLRSAVRAKADAQQLTVADDAQAFLTHSRRLKKPGLLARATKTGDPDTEHDAVLVIGGRDVLICTHGEHRGTVVLTARLEDVDTEDKLAAMRNDSGISVNGFPVSGGEGAGRGSFFFGLGAPDGDAAKAALDSAIRGAKA
jgi:hypothetical protein